MRILWLSTTPGLYPNGASCAYNGGGWIEGLQTLLKSCSEIELGLAFECNMPNLPIIEDGATHYFPIYIPPLTSWQKLLKYYCGRLYRREEEWLSKLQEIIQGFHPDVIHLFGLENPMAVILGRTEVPIVVHLQGLLLPYDNAFYPAGFNKTSFLFPLTPREWLYRNGMIFAGRNLRQRAQRERSLFQCVRHVMGRTTWDYQVSRLLSPTSSYCHVDEVLRSIFYEQAGKWRLHKGKFVIFSVLSETVYKGLDLVLKTAQLLKTTTLLNFEWHVVGVGHQGHFVRCFERILGIVGAEVGVHYEGVQNAEEVCCSLLSASVYVHPSYIDNSPNSLCEAQLLGLPTIATAVGGVPSLIEHGQTGWLVPANAPFELSYYLLQLATHPQQAEILGQRAAHRAAQRHHKARILQDLLSTYQVVEQKGKASSSPNVYQRFDK